MSRHVADPTRPKGPDGERPGQMLSPDGKALIGVHGSRVKGQPDDGQVLATVKLPKPGIEVEHWVGHAAAALVSNGVLVWHADHSNTELAWT